MLNFFVTLVNTIGLPVILVGTPKARDIFEKDFRSARRSVLVKSNRTFFLENFHS